MAVHSQGTVLKLGANSIAELNSIGGLSLSAESVQEQLFPICSS